MKMTGGCYCGALRYEITAKPVFKAECYCRACQHIAGGAPQYFMLVPEEAFLFSRGTAKSFTLPDKDNAVTRSFCDICGTHLVTKRPGLEGVIVKVGTLDDPAQFGRPRAAIFVSEKQPFHQISEDLPQFQGLP